MDSLQSLLPRVLRKRGLHVQAAASLVTYTAQTWLDKALPRYKGDIFVKKLSHATLSITCKNSIAAQECHGIVASLKEYLRKECASSVIEEIRLLRAEN